MCTSSVHQCAALNWGKQEFNTQNVTVCVFFFFFCSAYVSLQAHGVCEWLVFLSALVFNKRPNQSDHIITVVLAVFIHRAFLRFDNETSDCLPFLPVNEKIHCRTVVPG